MSLRAFHVVFISASSLLSFAFGGWSVHAWSQAGGAGRMGMAVMAFAVGLGLIVYGRWFLRKIRTQEQERDSRRKYLRTVKAVPVLTALWLLGSRTASACSVCYGEAEGPMIDAARLGVWLLFGLTVLVQAGFVSFFITLWKRARSHRDEET